jgi:hypothetical protein
VTNALPDFLVTYHNNREQQRAKAVDDFLAKLTPRERALFHDAAVMGYIQGLMRDRAEGAPKDSQTIALVVDACFAFPDLYPAVNTIARSKAPLEPVWQIETNQRGTWRQWLADRNNPEEARAEYEQCVAENGHQWAFRLVRADTTQVIEAQHAPEQDSEESE